jgi:hypothetical protein
MSLCSVSTAWIEGLLEQHGNVTPDVFLPLWGGDQTLASDL